MPPLPCGGTGIQLSQGSRLHDWPAGEIAMQNGRASSRRKFLKMAGGAAAVVSPLDRVGAAAETVPPQSEHARQFSSTTQAGGGTKSAGAALVELANPLQGTDSTSL